MGYVWNADLIKKGLRPQPGWYPSAYPSLKRRPDQKGIKTARRLKYIVKSSSLKRRPDQKGIKTLLLRNYNNLYGLKRRPDQKGIKTLALLINVSELQSLKRRPDQKGIKTLYVNHLCDDLTVWNADLIKKGLRPWDLHPLAYLSVWNADLIKKGLRLSIHCLLALVMFETQTWSKRD